MRVLASLTLFLPYLAAQPASRPLTIEEFAAVAKRCVPDAPISTLRAISKVESAFNPLAISFNYPDKAPERLGLDEGTVALARQPTTMSEAVRWTKWLYSRGLTVSVGLMQVNAEHLAGLGLSLEHAFDPCANLRAGWTILNTKYRTAAAVLGQGQLALNAAISSYNSGSLIAGFNNGYVDKVIQSKPGVSSIPALAGQLNRPGASSAPRSVDPPSVPPVQEPEIAGPHDAPTRVSWRTNKKRREPH
jgi:type IV secretion system protein VirB1